MRMHRVVDDEIEIIVFVKRPVGIRVLRRFPVATKLSVVVEKGDVRWGPLHRIHAPPRRVDVGVLERYGVPPVALGEVQRRRDNGPLGLHFEDVNFTTVGPRAVLARRQRPHGGPDTVRATGAQADVDAAERERHVILRCQAGRRPVVSGSSKRDVKIVVLDLRIVPGVFLYLPVPPAVVILVLCLEIPNFGVQAIKVVLKDKWPPVGLALLRARRTTHADGGKLEKKGEHLGRLGSFNELDGT